MKRTLSVIPFLSGLMRTIRKAWLLSVSVCPLFSSPASTYAQNTWTQKADLTGDGRQHAVAFTIGDKIYVGTGADGSFTTKNDFWEYNTANNTWTQKADFEGLPRYGAVGFSIDGKGYVGLGAGNFGATLYKDIWQYDPNTNDWIPFDDFGGFARQGATALVIGNKAYVVGGQSDDPMNPSVVITPNDVWEFDAGAGYNWTQKNNFPGTGRYYPASFSIASRGYIGGGSDVDNQALGDFWQYNPTADSWTEKAPLATGPRTLMPAFSINDKGYIGTAAPGDFWEYNPTTNSWTAKAAITPSALRLASIGVSANGKGYLGMGMGSPPRKELFEYTPEDASGNFAGKMYGSTVSGGGGSGMLFEASATGTAPTSIYNFDLGAINGTSPHGRLLAINGKLFGATPTGGMNMSGVLYKLDLNGNVYTPILDMVVYGNNTGSEASLTFANGKLYGTARSSTGFIFEYDPFTEVFTKKADFNGTNGSDPYGDLVLVGDRLYGMTRSGGTNDLGAVYEYDFLNNVITKKADFTGTNGAQPRGALTEFGGLLYGLTETGGTSDKGVLFEFDTNTGTLVKRKNFGGADGESPLGSLAAMNGKLYGLTSDSDPGWGVLFEFDPTTGQFQKKVDFDNNTSVTGGNPYGSLTLINGKLYGLTLTGGFNNKGTLFSYDVANGFSKIVDFNNTNGANPISSVTFVRANQTLSFNPLADKSIDDAPFQITATGSLGLPVHFTSSNVNVATINGNTVTITGAGTTTITAYIGRDNHFTAVNQVLTVVKKNQTITFNTLASKTFGDAAFQLGATASSSLAVNYISSNLNVATVSGNTITIVGAGTVKITAKQAGNSEYNPAPDIERDLTVAKATQTITFGQLPEKTFGNAAFELTATSTSGLPVSFESSQTPVASVNGTTVTVVGAGASTITARQQGNNNYSAATPVAQTLTVVKAFQEIFFHALTPKRLGDAPFTLVGTTTFSYTPIFTSSDPSVATISGTTVTLVGVGQTIIAASHGGNSNVLAAATVDRMLTVAPAKADQVITFAPLGTREYSPTFQLTATSNSGLPVQYASDAASVATVFGNTVTIHSLGTANITASQPGNDSFHAAQNVTRAVIIVKANQTITFEPISDKTLGNSSVALQATSTSGLPVSFASTSNKVQLLNGQLTLLAAGSATVDASQDGNNFYNPAPKASRTFCITPLKPTITLTQNNSGSGILTSSAPSGNQWYLNGNIINGAVNQSLTVDGGTGVYKVQTSVDGCASEFSNNFSITITGVEGSSVNERMLIYPNPVEDELTVVVPNNKGAEIEIVKPDGTIMVSFSTSERLSDIDVRAYASGFYLMYISTSESLYVGTFIKK